ncbi:MAG TPA: hypothetical protein VII05_07775 [Gaiellaceae bacterium]
MLPYDEYEKLPNHRARFSFFFALLGLVMAPAAFVLHLRLSAVTLIMAVGGMAVGCTIFGLIALYLARKARLRRVVSLERMGGAKQAALGRILGKLVLGIGLGAGIALGVYALLATR